MRECGIREHVRPRPAVIPADRVFIGGVTQHEKMQSRCGAAAAGQAAIRSARLELRSFFVTSRSVARSCVANRAPKSARAHRYTGRMGSKEKTPGKEKKEKKEKTPSKEKGGDDEDGEGGALRPVCAIAKPLADIGFHKKILKVVKKGTLYSHAVQQSKTHECRRPF